MTHFKTILPFLTQTTSASTPQKSNSPSNTAFSHKSSNAYTEHTNAFLTTLIGGCTTQNISFFKNKDGLQKIWIRDFGVIVLEDDGVFDQTSTEDYANYLVAQGLKRLKINDVQIPIDKTTRIEVALNENNEWVRIVIEPVVEDIEFELLGKSITANANSKFEITRKI